MTGRHDPVIQQAQKRCFVTQPSVIADRLLEAARNDGMKEMRRTINFVTENASRVVKGELDILIYMSHMAETRKRSFILSMK